MDPDEIIPQGEAMSGSARLNSLVIAAFPWAHGEIATATKLSNVVLPDQLSDVRFFVLLLVQPLSGLTVVHIHSDL